MDDQTRTWPQVLSALEYTHTMSVRDICQKMKASRSWCNRYVLPHVDQIYLNSNIRYNKQAALKVNWVQEASIALNRDYMKDSIWCSAADFEALIERSIIGATRQTRKLPLELLLKDPLAYKARHEELKEKMDAAMAEARRSRKRADIQESLRLQKEYRNLYFQFLNETGEKLLQNPPRVAERGKVPRVNYDGKIPEMDEWVAPHDLKGYGDTDEMIYRQLFSAGQIRIELAIPDADGVVGEKIYYVADPDQIRTSLLPDEYILVREIDYQKFKQLL